LGITAVKNRANSNASYNCGYAAFGTGQEQNTKNKKQRRYAMTGKRILYCRQIPIFHFLHLPDRLEFNITLCLPFTLIS
jgi:hypothetical protein